MYTHTYVTRSFFSYVIRTSIGHTRARRRLSGVYIKNEYVTVTVLRQIVNTCQKYCFIEPTECENSEFPSSIALNNLGISGTYMYMCIWKWTSVGD